MHLAIILLLFNMFKVYDDTCPQSGGLAGSTLGAIVFALCLLRMYCIDSPRVPDSIVFYPFQCLYNHA